MPTLRFAAPKERRLAIVTGGARGIGGASAIRLAEEGRDVVIADLNEDEAAETMAKIEALGRRAVFITTDVSNEIAVQEMIAQAVDGFGRLDILVCCAGIFGRETPFLEMSLEEWHEILSVALDGAFILAKAAVPEMIRRGGGSLIGLSGVSHHAGAVGRVHVNASKAGLEGLIRGLAMELAPHGITANCVAPGSIDTVRGPSAGGPQGRGSLGRGSLGHGGTARGMPVSSPETLARGEATVVCAVGARGARDLIRAHLSDRGFVEGEDFLFAS